MEICPALHVKNEEFWIGHVLKDILKVFKRAIIIDTGSTDRTVDIIKHVAGWTEANVTLIQEDMQNDPNRIGRCSTRLREMVQTEWMLLIDGDEIWREPGLRALKAYEPPAGKTVCIVNGRNLRLQDGRIMRADGWSADRLFARGVRWDKRTDYPFQSYGLDSHLDKGLVHYIEHPDVWFWHVRHLRRSSHDADAFFRGEKAGYFPYSGPLTELPPDWLGPSYPGWPNPYLGTGE